MFVTLILDTLGMKQLLKCILMPCIALCGTYFHVVGQSSPPALSPSIRPSLPMNIPPPPSFASLSSKSGKYQIVSAEYYSEDAKPFLYKRLSSSIPQLEKLGFWPLKLDRTVSRENGYR